MDGQPKSAAWASELSGIPEATIIDMARAASDAPSLISVSWSLQRQIYGEQTWWMITVLGAMLGFIGQPGAGIGYGYGCIHNMGFGGERYPTSALALLVKKSGERVACAHQFIPVARIADMLEHPGEPFDYNGQRLTYPDIDWSIGRGQPFHHHQDLNRLREAWQISSDSHRQRILLDSYGQACRYRFSGQHFSREEVTLAVALMTNTSHPCAPRYHRLLTRAPIRRIFGLAERLGFGEAFTQGRNEMAWVEHLYEETVVQRRQAGQLYCPTSRHSGRASKYTLGINCPLPNLCWKNSAATPKLILSRRPAARSKSSRRPWRALITSDCGGTRAGMTADEWLGGVAIQYPLHSGVQSTQTQAAQPV